MTLKRILCIVYAFALTGCASGFQRPTQNTYYGNPPQAYEQTIKSSFEQTLKDPESARYRIGKPVKAYRNTGLFYGGNISWSGYLVDVQVNAKNSFGGYVGFKPYIVLFSEERIFKVLEGGLDFLTHPVNE